MKKTAVSVFLLTAMLLVGCGEAAQNPTPAETKAQNTPATEAVTDEGADNSFAYPRPDLPEMNLGGGDFVILNANTAEWMMTNVVTAAEENGDALNDAIYRRNRAVEEQFNVHIKEIVDSGAKGIAKKAVSAGDNAYDDLQIMKGDALELVLQNCLVDFADIPYIQTNMPWWVQNSMRDMSIANHVYYGVSKFDTSHYDSVRTLFFNKEMLTRYDLPDLYALVNDGKWTIDRMREMALTVAQDLDGDGAWTDADQYGYCSWSSVGCQALMTGCDASLSLHKDADDMPYFDMNTTFYIERLEALTAMLNEQGFKNPGCKSENHGGLDYFMAGNSLFYSECMGNAQSLRQMELDFGILPSPKYNEAQENYRNVGGNPMFHAILITVPDLDRIGAILEALAYESMTTVKIAAYDEMLWGKVSRDNDSEDMLNIIYSTLSYDMPIAATIVNGNITDNYMWKNKTDFASYFSKNESKIQKEIDKTVDAYLSAQD
ncbi:MAG: hypothetical protein MJ175_09540 [Clostridia bacterium]|nr:hypothetical protein [Clostridia bacterium]